MLMPTNLECTYSTDELKIQNNNNKGIIINCEDFVALSTNCTKPKSIICPCCTVYFRLFSSKNVLPCPLLTLWVKLLEEIKDLNFLVEKENSQLVIEYYSDGRDIDVHTCILPTDCMKIIPYNYKSFAVTDNDNVLFDTIDSG